MNPAQPSVERNAYPSNPAGQDAARGFFGLGMRLFRDLRFSFKTWIIAVAIGLPLIVLLVWQLYTRYEDAYQSRMDATRQHVEIAHGILAWAQAQQSTGGLTQEQAQSLARQALVGLRYEGQEYFWVNDMQARMVMHPMQPELDGRNLADMRDPNGFRLFHEFVQIVQRQGKGFVSYQWPKPGHSEPVDKISYVMGFEPWGWVIGSGVYVDDLDAMAWQRLNVSAGIVALVVLIAAYLIICFYRVMQKGLSQVRRHLHAMKEGDLTLAPKPWGKDELARLVGDLASMQESLRAMVMRVRNASDDIMHSSSEIAGGVIDLASRTEQTAANLEQTASAMEQINATVKNATDNTSECARVAQHSAQAAANGGKVMREVVSTMEGIRTSSARIHEIVSTIDSIAFQTNILALNAAVEAARTGELGRGFAVVAGEVRMLAHRTTTAASEIKTLISNSVDQVEAGTAVVREASEMIEDIVASSQRVNQLLDEVAIGAQEQNLGIAQIDQAVQELDRMTQENAALVEQSATSASSMREEAEMLVQNVAQFRLPGGAPVVLSAEAHVIENARPAPRMTGIKPAQLAR